MKKNLLFLLALSFMVLMLVACGSSDDEGTNSDTSKDKETEEAATVTVTHELGETEVPKNPEKVVVFDFGILDSLDKLGVDAVVGVAKSGTLPEYISKYAGDEYENIGSLKEPDFEKIAEIDPDLIIISGRQAELYDQLEELAPTVHLGVDTTKYMESFKENMNALGEIFDVQDAVETELAAIDESIAALDEKATASGKNSLIILANDDKVSAYGPSSRFGLIHDVFGVPAADEGIESSTHGQNISFEFVMETNPDILYVIDRGAVVANGEGESGAKQLVENELVKNTEAYKNEDIYYLNPEFWYLSGGGLTSVSEMIKEIDASLGN